MKNILVPIDFSPASHNAALYAVSLAQIIDVKVYLVNVVLSPISVDSSIRTLLQETSILMNQEIAKLSKGNSVKIEGFLREGYAEEKIAEAAKEVDAGLIVMGMKGERKGVSVFGSITTAFVRETTYPVFVIPDEATYKPIENITFASDFDPTTEIDRYSILLDLAEGTHAQINLLNVQKDSSSISLEDIIGKMKTSIAFSRHKHSFNAINGNNIEEGINKFIESNATDVLAMVAHKHSIFDRLFGKVHTQRMSYQTKIPLLILQNE